jgi:hypothetical protein
LKIKVSSIKCIQKLARCFPRLEELDLYGSFIPGNISPKTFSNFPDLKKLNLRYCSVHEIHPQAFNHLLNLTELDLSDNDSLTTFQMEGRVVPRVLKAIDCRYLETVKLLDYDSPSSFIIDELLLMRLKLPKTGPKTTLEGPSRLFSNIRHLALTPTHTISFDAFGGLERLTLDIEKFDDIKPGQLASLCRLKKLYLKCTASCENGLQIIIL